jgi:hypothetical protein
MTDEPPIPEPVARERPARIPRFRAWGLWVEDNYGFYQSHRSDTAEESRRIADDWNARHAQGELKT